MGEPRLLGWGLVLLSSTARIEVFKILRISSKRQFHMGFLSHPVFILSGMDGWGETRTVDQQIDSWQTEDPVSGSRSPGSEPARLS